MWSIQLRLYEGESNENLEYVLYRNLLYTKLHKMTSFFYVVSYCHLSAILQTMSIIVETYRQSS